MKGKVFKNCVRSAMLYGNEMWRLKENKVTILRQEERSMVKAMDNIKLVDKG